MEQVQKLMKQHKVKNILDVATGSGQFIKQIQSVYNDYDKIIGIDSNDKAIAQAEKTFDEEEDIQFVQADIMTYSSEQDYDLITISNTLHHLDNLSQVFEKFLPLLVENGHVIVQEMCKNHLNEKQMTHVGMHHFWAKIDVICGVVHKETYDREEIIELMEQMEGYSLVGAWDLPMEDYSITEDEKNWLKDALKRSLDKLDDKAAYPELIKEAADLEVRLEEVGFQLATEMIIVLKKS
jgi:ubiquinone/menaquinone biosynthesis C-methylase UbiE